MDSSEHVANTFAAYMRDNIERPHVFRVTTWLGMLILAIDKVKTDWWISTPRQLFFSAVSYDTNPEGRYKVRFNHSIRPRGGLEIIEVGTGRGQAELGVVATFASLSDVERFHQLCSTRGWDFSAILAAHNSVRPVVHEDA